MEPDAELMRLTRAGDQEAFARLVDRYKDSLVNYLTHLSGSRDRAEDLAQEAFVRLYARSARYDEQGKLAPYLFRIATNVFRSENRRARRWSTMISLLFSTEEGSSTPQTLLLQAESSSQIRKALESLPLKLRAPVILREIEGWSYREISQALGCREGTIKSRISRGREELRRRLAGYRVGGLPHEGRRARASLGTPS